jgi:hypothetical protein
MNEVGRRFVAELDQLRLQSLTKQLPTARQRVAEELFNWLALRARKKDMPDMADRLKEMRKRFEVLADRFELAIERGKLVVRATGEAQATLRMLERGTDWFDPASDAAGLIAGAVLG